MRSWLAVLLTSLAVAPSGGTAPTTAEPVRILFLGNSYTAGQGSVADMVTRTAAARGGVVTTEQIAPGGYTLQGHYGNAAGSRDRIAAGGWDWVVLQEQSQRPILDPELFFTYARLLDQDIRAVGARTLFFLTWAREWAPESQVQLDQAYCSVAEELGTGVAPVGMAWALARERDSLIQLHASDGSHQSGLGQYLLGMAFHRRLWDESPAGLPRDVSPYVTVTVEQALFLQQVAVDAPAGCPTIFADGFESMDTSAWSLTVP